MYSGLVAARLTRDNAFLAFWDSLSCSASLLEALMSSGLAAEDLRRIGALLVAFLV